MNINFDYKHRNASEIESLLNYLNDSYTPVLSEQVDFKLYSEKLAKNAEFIFLLVNDKTIGWVAYYVNQNESFITSIGIHKDFHGLKLREKLYQEFEKTVLNKGVKLIKLEVPFKFHPF